MQAERIENKNRMWGEVIHVTRTLDNLGNGRVNPGRKEGGVDVSITAWHTHRVDGNDRLNGWMDRDERSRMTRYEGRGRKDVSRSRPGATSQQGT